MPKCLIIWKEKNCLILSLQVNFLFCFFARQEHVASKCFFHVPRINRNARKQQINPIFLLLSVYALVFLLIFELVNCLLKNPCFEIID